MAEQVELPKGVSKKEAEKFLSQQPVVFETFETGPNSQVRIHRTCYKGKGLNSIQKFWREDENQEWQYGKAITFHYEHIDKLISGLKQMQIYCEEHPDEEDS